MKKPTRVKKMGFTKIFEKIKSKSIKWVKKKPTNSEIFSAIGLLILGKWVLTFYSVYILSFATGVLGIELTEEAQTKMTEKMVESLIGAIGKLNQLGLSYENTLTGKLAVMALYSLPWLALTYFIVVGIVFLRMGIGHLYFKNKQKKKAKQNGN